MAAAAAAAAARDAGDGRRNGNKKNEAANGSSGGGGGGSFMGSLFLPAYADAGANSSFRPIEEEEDADNRRKSSMSRSIQADSMHTTNRKIKMSPQKNLTIATSNDQADSVLPINKLQVAEKQYKKMEIKFNYNMMYLPLFL